MSQLTPLQGFNAAFQLFEMYYEETGSENITTMLSSMVFSADKRVFDAGMWEIWIESVHKILDDEGIQNREHLTALQALKAIPLYLEAFYGTDYFKDIIILVTRIRKIEQDSSIHNALWKQWMQCINNVLSVEDSRYYGN